MRLCLTINKKYQKYRNIYFSSNTNTNTTNTIIKDCYQLRNMNYGCLPLSKYSFIMLLCYYYYVVIVLYVMIIILVCLP